MEADLLTYSVPAVSSDFARTTRVRKVPKQNMTARHRISHQSVTLACCLAFAIALGGCGSTESADVSEQLKESIIEEAVGDMHPTIANAVNEAVEECELEAQTALEDFQSCLTIQSGEPLEDALLVCTPDPPSCDKW
jgi:hypothetical protein